jgi:hypothetical protein
MKSKRKEERKTRDERGKIRWREQGESPKEERANKRDIKERASHAIPNQVHF